MINVCFTIDSKFTEYCATTIMSILMNSGEDYHFYILHPDLKPDDKKKLKSLKRFRSFEMTFVKESIEKVSKYYIPLVSHFSHVCYFKLMIASSLPDVDKVIYLDSDVIVNRDLKYLWKIPFDNAYIIGCESRTSNKNRPRLKLSTKKPYINSGVMVMDLEKMRRDNIEDKFFEYLDRGSEGLRNMDQDTRNCVLSKIKGSIKLILQNWNVEVRTDTPAESDYLPVINNPYIIHYLTKDKPWHKDSKQIYKEKWEHYNKQICLYQEIK